MIDSLLDAFRKAAGFVLLIALILSVAMATLGLVTVQDGANMDRWYTSEPTDDGCAVYVHYENGTSEKMDSTDDQNLCDKAGETMPSSKERAQEQQNRATMYGGFMLVAGIGGAALSGAGIWRLSPNNDE